ncbi:sensor histidine kinase [Gryllotalpicola protaetiae]|uniref:histidine kinase n=1 Tax=Gryllotalpicola protaetiae TaxID=2419771 RepID=A0A387BGH0_9MICO|nr:histidine kinase [Gryllotalpicola protaetiae]AYG03023.1 two-component sensor histidine kinase [Gryllotalpicola protaetiae]
MTLMDASDRRLLPLVLNAIGMAVVVYAFVATGATRHGGWLVIATILALLTWAVVELLQWRFVGTLRRRSALRVVRRVATVLGVVVASFAQAPSEGLHTAPLAILVILAVSDESEPIWFGASVSALSFILTPIGAVLAHAGPGTLLGYLAGNAVWLLIGVSRRQARTATRRNQELAEQQRELAQQEATASALAARQAAARDIHDVLAHSLGGLVIQLDAAEALLESGRTEAAHAKVTQARRLATDGLTEARRAVSALRAPGDSDAAEQTPADLAGAAERLLRAHRELGGEVDAHVDLGAAPPLTASVATAFERALQESLSNARRHAPGEPVAVELSAAGGCLELTVSNPMLPGRARSAAGGGHGLTGMTERFAALAGGRATAAERDGRFVVSASASVAQG